jgi:hypothetical protein
MPYLMPLVRGPVTFRLWQTVCRFPDQSTSFMQVSETFVPLGRVGSTERPISGQTSLDEQLCCVVPGIKAVENLHNRDAI